MGRYIFNRLAYGILVLFGVVLLVFFLFNILPGDPARMLMGQRSDLSSEAAIRHELGYDKPLFYRFTCFLNDLSPVSLHNTSDTNSYIYLQKDRYPGYLKLFSTGQGNMVMLKSPYLNRSYQSRRLVSEILGEAFLPTFILATVAMLAAALTGILLGIISAVFREGFMDRIITVLSVAGMSLPSFFAAILIAWLFAYVLAGYTGLNMTGSLYSVDDFGRGEYLNLRNLILPAFTLAIRPVAIITELTRSSLLAELSQDYVRTAKAKGAGTGRIIFGHALRNAMNPVITSISGWFASLMAGAVFVEYIFDWKGMGYLIVDALSKYDFPVLMGAVLFISVLLIIISLATDIVYAFLDPRIRYT